MMWAQLVTASALVTVIVAAVCPEGFEDFGIDDNLCYQISPEDKSWTSSFTSCLKSSEEANLLAVRSEEEFFLVVYFARQKGTDVWTGLISLGGTRSWADGTPYNDDLDQFMSNDTGSGIYGYISAEDGLFHIDDGNVQHGRVCYMDVTPPTTSTPTTTTREPTTTPTPPACEDDWVQYTNSCYYFSQDEEYWASTSHSCHQMGAEPLSIHDDGALTFLLLQAKQNKYWIGLADQNNTFVYEDGTSTDDVEHILGGYLDEWEEGADCLGIDPSKFPLVISHTNCFQKLPYTCYKPALEVSAELYWEWV